MIPAARNDSQTADPAMAAASPINAKMPAPTMEPTPSEIAARVLIRLVCPCSLICQYLDCTTEHDVQLTDDS